MQLYHYAAQRFDILKTRRASGIATAAEIRKAEEQAKKWHDEGAYVDHISFFFDPIPAKLLPTIFGDDHRVWHRGNRLFEYVIDTADIEENILYRVVESRRKTAYLDQFSKEHNWIDDDPALLMKWIHEINRLQTKWGELGRGRAEMEMQIALNQGRTEEAYVIASQREDFEDGKQRYASNVPHLMVYPSSGMIPFRGINSLVMGSDKRTTVYRQDQVSKRW